MQGSLKTCSMCVKEKPLSDFESDRRRVDGLRPYCAECSKKLYKHDKRNEYLARREVANRYQRKRAARKRERNKQYIVNYLSDRSCEICGESDPRCLSFDHIDPGTKFKCVGVLVCQGYSLHKLQEEINKCRILCHNCHSKHTKEQNGGSYYDRMEPISQEEFNGKYGDLP